MGADGWTYFVPYQEDLEQAMRDLQQDLFQQGEYWLFDYSDLTLETFLSPDYKEWMGAEEIEANRALLQHLQNGPKPQTIDELREWQGAEGCGSILDMRFIGARGTPDTIALLTPTEREALYGTLQPTHEQIDNGGQGYFDYCERGEGIAIIVYRDGVPDEMFFAGISGD